MYFPPKIAIPICIEQGSVYHYEISVINKDGSKYNGNRFFIVLNVNPKTDEIIYLTTITKQVTNLKKHIKNINEDSDTVVEITLSDFSFLNHLSAIDCNKYYEKSLSELVSSIEDGGKIFVEKLPKIIVDKIIKGVIKSNQVPQGIKKKII